MSMTLDTRQFTAAMWLYEKATKKDCAYILNKGGKQAAMGSKEYPGAYQLTPRAQPTRIDAELGSSRQQRIGKRGKALKGKKNEYSAASAYLFRIIQKIRNGKRLSNFHGQIPKWLQGGAPGMSKRAAAERLIAGKRSSCGYIALGWIKAARDLGMTSRVRISQKGDAFKRSGATAATERSLVTTIYNGARGAEKVGRAALQQGINSAAADMRAHGEKKLAETAQRAGFKVKR
jgi:hypothetical protein